MKITTILLSEKEKDLLKKVLKIRIFIGLLFLPPLFAGSGFLLYRSIAAFADHAYDAMSVVGIILALLVGFLVSKYVIPFYRRSFKNLQAGTKVFIETSITSIEVRNTSKGPRYIVGTEYMVIDSWKVSILQPGLAFSEMNLHMPVAIQQTGDNKMDILCITRL